jgi:hypothetical protein
MRTVLFLLFPVIFQLPGGLSAQTTADWPQLMRDPARTARTEASIDPPFRARWFWLGPDLTLRNKAVNPEWPDDLESVDGHSFPVPSAYPVTLARGIQPVVAGGRMFVGTLQGTVHGIEMDDGTTLWSYDMGDPVITTACADQFQVLFVDVHGDAVALDASSGTVLWQFTADRSITTAPLLLGDQVYLASHSGRVYCLAWSDGHVVWEHHLPAPIQGQLAATAQRVFVPAEDMIIYALNRFSGQLLAQKQVVGQSFRLTHPVVFGDKLWVTTCMIPAVGSEGVFDDVLDMSGSLEEEEALTLQFLRGQGGFAEASPDWQHLFALDTLTLDTTYLIPNGPIEGVGFPLAGVGITHDDQVVTWFRTRYPTLTHNNPAFGTAWPIDIAAIDPTTGRRTQIDNGVFSQMFPGPETDNLYIFSTAGEYLWYRQPFRGTQVIHLPTSQHTLVMVRVRSEDGGYFDSDIALYDTLAQLPKNAQRPIEGKGCVVILESVALIPDVGGILAIQSK